MYNNTKDGIEIVRARGSSKMGKTKWIVGMIVLVAIALGMAGCSSEKKATDKSFVYAMQADARNLDPHMSTDAPSSAATSKKVYEGLVTIDKDNKLVPLLATEWKQIDPLTLEITLRKGVKFHDGTDFNAEAVKINFDRLLDSGTKRNRRAILSAVKEVKVVAPDKVQIITEQPSPSLLLHLTHSAGFIMSPAAIAADLKGEKALAQNPVGTGPFVFTEWKKGDQIILTRNESYWGKKPEIAKLILKVVPEDVTRVAMVRTGEAQAADQAPVTEVDKLSQDPKVTLVRTPVYRSEFISFNTEKGPFSNPKVRKAVAAVIDYDGLIKGVYNGVGKSSVSSIGPQVFGHNPNLKPYVKNLEEAKKLMAEAGVPNGFKATLYVPDRKVRVKMAEVVQAQLKPLGIEVEIKTMEFGAYLKATEEGQQDFCIDGWSNQTGDADFSMTTVFGTNGIKTGQNIARYSNPRVDALLASARIEMNPQKREKMYQEIQEILREDVPIIVTRIEEDLTITGKNITGLWVGSGGGAVFNDVVFK